MTLKDLHIGQSGCISKVGGNGELRQHFLDMGIIPGTVLDFYLYPCFYGLRVIR